MTDHQATMLLNLALESLIDNHVGRLLRENPFRGEAARKGLSDVSGGQAQLLVVCWAESGVADVSATVIGRWKDPISIFELRTPAPAARRPVE